MIAGKAGVHPFGPAAMTTIPAPGHYFTDVAPAPSEAGANDKPDPAPAGIKKPRILNSPRPHYTDEAVKHRTEGQVLLRVLFGADGRVQKVRVSKGLPDGLNDEAVIAAYKF